MNDRYKESRGQAEISSMLRLNAEKAEEDGKQKEIEQLAIAIVEVMERLKAEA